MLVDLRSGTIVINTKHIEQVISNLLKENKILIHQLGMYENMKIKCSKLIGSLKAINDQLSREHKAIENQTREIVS